MTEETTDIKKTVLSRVLGVVKFIFTNRKLVTIILSLVGLGSVATVFGPVSEAICQADTEICSTQ